MKAYRKSSPAGSVVDDCHFLAKDSCDHAWRRYIGTDHPQSLFHCLWTIKIRQSSAAYIGENCAQTVPKHPEYPFTEPHGTASSSPLSRCKHCVFNMYEVGDRDSKSADRKVVGVRPPLPAPIKSMICKINASSDAFFCAQTVPKLLLSRSVIFSLWLFALCRHCDVRPIRALSFLAVAAHSCSSLAFCRAV
jgi:hypothetical protein